MSLSGFPVTLLFLAFAMVACGASHGREPAGAGMGAPSLAGFDPKCGPLEDVAPVASRPPRATIQAGHERGPEDIVVSPGGGRVATIGSDGVRVWSLRDRTLLAVAPRPEACTRMRLDGWLDERRLLFGCGDGKTPVFDVETNRVELLERTFAGELTRIPKGPVRWASVESHEVWLFDEKWQPAGELHRSIRGQLVASDDGSTLATATDDELVLWRAEGKGFPDRPRFVRLPRKKVLSGAIALSADGKSFAYVAGSGKRAGDFEAECAVVIPTEGAGTPRVLELPWQPLPRGRSSIYRLAFVGSDRLAGQSHDKTVVWEIARERAAWVAEGTEGVGLAVADGGATVLSPSTRGVTRMRSARTGRVVGQLGSWVASPSYFEWLDEERMAIASPVGDVQGQSDAELARDWDRWDDLDRWRLRVFSLPTASLVTERHLARVAGLGTAGGEPIPILREHGKRSRCGEKAAGLGAAGSAPRCVSYEGGFDLRGVSAKEVVVTNRSRDDERAARIDLATGKATPLARAPGAPKCERPLLATADFSLSGRYVGMWTCERLHLWDASGAVVWAEPLPTKTSPSATTLAVSADERRAAVFFNGYDRRSNIVLIDLPSGRPSGSFEVGPARGREYVAQAVAFGPTNDVLALLLESGRLDIYRGSKLERSVDLGHYLGISSALEVSPKGTRAAVRGRDGTVRIFDLPSGRLLATLADFQDGEWVLFTPGGAYAGTAEVSERVAWLFDGPVEAFRFEQFASYRDPALVGRRLAGSDVDAKPIAHRPPRVEARVAKIDGGVADLVVRATSGRRVDSVRAFVEGVPAAARAVCAKDGEVHVPVPLVAGTNRVSVLAYDDRGFASNAASLDVGAPEAKAAPEAWVVAVGIDRYPRLPESMQLSAAENDARGIAKALEAQAGPGRLYRTIHQQTLLGERATPAAIRSALGNLAKMAPTDLAVVFFAGHGIKRGRDGDMVFVTSGAALDPGGGLSRDTADAHTISWAQIAEALAPARGRVLVLLDACHSGDVTRELVVPNDALAAELASRGRAGVVVFAAAKGRQVSFEPDSSRGLVLDAERSARVRADVHGFFTGAILESLGAAETDRDRDGQVQLSELVDDVVRRVTDASQGQQTPWVARRELVGDFALARVSR